MNKEKIKNEKRERRRKKIRSKINGTAKRPRLSVFKSNKNIYAQLIDDTIGRTLVSVHSLEIKPRGVKSAAKKKGADTAPAEAVNAEFGLGQLLAKKAGEKKIKTAVFDRGGYKYHGRIKSFADGARAGGLVF